MKTRLAISLAAVSLLAASTAAFAQSTTEQGARDGARAGGDIGGPVGAMVGGTVGAAVGAGLEIPNAVLGGIPRDNSVVIHERVVVGERLAPDRGLAPGAELHRVSLRGRERPPCHRRTAHAPGHENHRLIGQGV